MLDLGVTIDVIPLKLMRQLGLTTTRAYRNIYVVDYNKIRMGRGITPHFCDI